MKIIYLIASVLLIAGCNRKPPIRADSEFVQPKSYVPGSDPGATPGGRSSSHSNDAATTPPPVPDEAERQALGKEAELGEGRKQEDGGSNRPTAGTQESQPQKP